MVLVRSGRRVTRRQRLLAITAGASFLALGGATAAALYHRAAQRYNPAAPAEGITEELARHLPPDYPRVTFAEVSQQAGVQFQHFSGTRSTQLPEDMGSGAAWGDYNNDGSEDLFVVNGSTFQDEKDPRKLIPMRELLFWNRNNTEGFYEVGRVSGPTFSQPAVGRGAAFADYDNDGDVDAFVVNHGGCGWLLRNEGGNRKHWLAVKVRGRRNRFGVGTKVRVASGGSTQMQEIGAQASYLSQNSLTAHFGLGPAQSADQVIVTFPSGRVVKRQDVPSNQTITVTEP